MTKRAGFSLAVLATAILLLAQNAPRAFAQDQDYPPDQPQYQQGDQDPPTRAGRLSDIEGSVSFQPGGEGDWLDAVRNRPLTIGDNLWVDKDSRAEIQIGSTSIRLGPETSVTFLNLGNNVTQLRLSLGSLYFRVRRFDRDDAFEVDTPNLAFNVSRAGTFRVDTNENGDQTIADVFRGEAEITGSGNSYRLDEGQEGTFSGTDQLSYDVGDIQSPDDFGRWAQSRDERQDRARSREYVSQDMTGYEDLDDYGSWRNDPEYGNVWQPAGIPGDWAPYRYGHWAYVSPWGWTWVEDEPWGFAPFHYGRWAFVRSSWCWVPGPVAVAPVYAPALVAFVGGAGFSVGIGIGSQPVGWFPLGPREVYVPWYHTSPRYVQNVNVTNTRVSVVQVTNVYNNYTVNKVTNVTYVNQHINNSVTVVNHDTFVNARPVNRNIQRVDARQLANARVTPAVVRNVQPSRQSYMGTAHAVQYRPPQQAMSRQVVATRQPVAYNRPANRRNGGPNGGPGGAGRPAPPPVKTVRAAPPAQVQPLQRGARGGPNPTGPGARPGQPNREANRPGQPNAPGNRPGQPNGAENRPGQPNGPENRGAAPRPGQPNAPENRPGQPNAPDNRGAAPRPGQPNNGPDNRGAAPRPGQPNAPENRPGQQNAPDNRGAAPRPGQPNVPDNRGGAPRPGQPNDNRPGQPNAPENRGAAPRPGQPNDNRPGQPNSPRPGAPENRNVPRPGAPNNAGPNNAGPNNGARDNAPGRPNNAPRPGAPDNRPAPPENRNAPGDNGRPGQQVPRPPSANRPDQALEQQPRQYPGTRPENNRPQEPPQARPENNRPQEAPQMRPQQPSRPPETPQTRPEQPARPPEARQQPAPQPRQDIQRNPPPPQARPAEPPPQRESRPAPPPQREYRPAPPPQRESRPAPPPQRESRPAPPPPQQRESRPAPPPQRENHPAPPPRDKDKEPPKSH
jgi:hypothetical protein